MAMNIDKLIAVLQAAKAGATIQFRNRAFSDWTDTLFHDNLIGDTELRVKPREPLVAWLNVYGNSFGAAYEDRETANASRSVYGKTLKFREVDEE